MSESNSDCNGGDLDCDYSSKDPSNEKEASSQVIEDSSEDD